VLFECGKEVGTDNFNLSSRFLIHEAFDYGPDATEKHWCIDYEEISHDFRVVIGAHLCRQFAEAVGL